MSLIRILLPVLALGAGACSLSGLGKSVGQGGAEGALDYVRSDSGRASVRQIADSSLGTLTRSAGVSFLPMVDSNLTLFLGKVRSTGRGVMDDGRNGLKSAQDSLASGLEGPLAASLEKLIRRNIGAAGDEGRKQIQLMMRQLSGSFSDELSPALARSVARVSDSVIARLAIGMRGELKVAAESAVASAVRAGVAAGSKEAERSPILRNVAIFGGAALALLAGFLVYRVWREKKRSQEALDVVTQVISAEGDDRLKGMVKERASRSQVEDWLHSYLEKRGRL